MTRDKIREAIELLRDAEGSRSPQDPQPEQATASAQRSVIALEALLKLEEKESGNNEECSGTTPVGSRIGEQKGKPDRSARKSLNNKVVCILRAFQGNTKNVDPATEQASSNFFSIMDMAIPLPTVADGFQDLDLLPVLSNNPSYDFWQFLDFDPPPQSPTESGSFSATADMQTLVGSIPFRSSLDMAHSLSSFGTPEFADVYSNTDGTGATQASALSIESGYSKLSRESEAATTPSSTDAYLAAKFH